MLVPRQCENCGRQYMADSRNLKRGWGKCCSKSCAAQKRERFKRAPSYNETYIQSKIAKVGDRFKGVDVDAYIHEMRGSDYPQTYEDSVWADMDQWGDMEFGIHE